ncbi:olfactory receptor 10G6-like [Erythrolamprus reginae]|uniref:olfactory receptor 10G6-like n=1 Tax=Erythrolamprus reginae TaxID=121349 RepID=UPI00396C91D8
MEKISTANVFREDAIRLSSIQIFLSYINEGRLVNIQTANPIKAYRLLDGIYRNIEEHVQKICIISIFLHSIILINTLNSKELECENQTTLMHFVLLGFPYPPILHIPLLLFFVCIYLLTLLSNLVVFLATIHEPQLHKPMYWLLCHLAIVDIATSTIVVPKMIVSFLDGNKGISFAGCVTQLFFYHFVGCTECFLYTVMAYDRFLAICWPLHYSILMNRKICLWLCMGTWFGGGLHSIIETTLTFQLPYGPRNEISYIFCDIPAMLKLACTDTSFNQMFTLIDIGLVAMSCVLLILVSYVYIVFAILRIRNADGQRHAFSTCTAHVILVITFYTPLGFTYLRPGAEVHLGGAVAIFYTTVTPFLNPVIYTLRNKEMKNAILRLNGRKS